MLHVFGFRWKPAATPADEERARTEILAFQGSIPGLLETHVGRNISVNESNYTFAGAMRFADAAAFAAYNHHPSHDALLAWLLPLIDAVELDFSF